MIKHATGTFEVKVFPLTATDESANLVRMLLDKRFSGDLTAVSKGEMLADNNGTKDSGGYVAMERVTGTLGDKSGTFVLQHSGTMINGVAQMSVTVVPESGTNQLTGLTGKMMINIENGKHSYDFEYTLPAASENKQKD